MSLCVFSAELPLTAGFITCEEESKYRPGTFKGKCKLEDKHAGSWGLSQVTSGGYDGRASFFVDSIRKTTIKPSSRQ